MEFLYVLESIRMPVLNECMLLITKFGEETAFLVAALIVFWCVDKKKGYYIMAVGFIGTLANQFLKLWFRIPRPWVRDESFTILEAAREAASGYSFPSGHSQNAVGTFGAIAAVTKKSYVKYICIAICFLVPVSRMYIGVHTPADVLAGSALALVLVWLLKKPVLSEKSAVMVSLIAGMLLLAVGLLLFVQCWPFPDNVDVHNLESGVKNAYTMLGCLVGIAVVYPIEKRFVSFPVKAVWWVQILKVLGGLLLVLIVKEGLRVPLELVFSGHLAARAVRYFLIVVTAGLVWPLTFPYLSWLGVNNELRRNQKL